VNEKVVELASALEQMIEDVIERGWDLDLHRLVRNDVKWSNFVQYLAHSYRKIGDHTQFLSDTEKLLKRTYAYHRLSEHQPEIAEQLIESTRIYAEQLSKIPTGILTLVDSTGFSPESVMALLGDKESFTLKADEWSPSKLFQAGGENMKGLVGTMLKVPELNIQTIGSGDGGSIAAMIEMWVSGKSLRKIADQHFSEISDIQKRLTECCKMVYRTLTHQGSWGLGAIQSMSGLSDMNISAKEREEISSIPSMIYFGVPTIEAVLMRNLGVPRSISIELGQSFAKEINAKNNSPKLQRARAWIETCSADKWEEAAKRANISMDGKRMMDVWRIITGQTR
jgi:hypothetical protein